MDKIIIPNSLQHVNIVQAGKARTIKSPIYKSDEYIDGRVIAIVPFPAAFTPICGSELPMYNSLKTQLELLNATIYFVSCDNVEKLIKYTTNGEIENGLLSVGELNYPIISDVSGDLLSRLSLLEENSIPTPIRGLVVFAFDKFGATIKIHSEKRHKNISRNVGDLLTIIRAYRYIEQNDGRCLPNIYQELETLAYYHSGSKISNHHQQEAINARNNSSTIPIDPALR